MNRNLSFLIPLLMALILTGCASRNTPAPASTAAILETQPSTPEPTSLSPTPTIPIPTPTATPYIPLSATILFDDLRLRVGPGYLFDTIDLFAEGDKVKVLGKEPGECWLYVQTSTEQIGWMKIEGLQLDSGYLFEIPEVSPDNVMILKGHVWASNHNPASQLSVAFIPGGGVDQPTEATATTNDRGEWYIYLPEDLRGEYTLTVNGYGCKSNVVTTNCALVGKFPEPQSFQLPVNPDLWIEFQME